MGGFDKEQDFFGLYQQNSGLMNQGLMQNPFAIQQAQIAQIRRKADDEKRRCMRELQGIDDAARKVNYQPAVPTQPEPNPVLLLTGDDE